MRFRGRGWMTATATGEQIFEAHSSLVCDNRGGRPENSTDSATDHELVFRGPDSSRSCGT